MRLPGWTPGGMFSTQSDEARRPGMLGQGDQAARQGVARASSSPGSE